MIKDLKEGIVVTLAIIAIMTAIGAIIVILGKMYFFGNLLKGY